jgi:type IV secretion system protein VirB5
MKLRNKVKAIALVAAFTSAGAQAGIPVFDGMSIAQSIIQVMNWVQQLEDMATSVQTESSQLQSMTGKRMLGEILNDPNLQNYMPDNAEAIYSSITSTGYSGLTAQAKTLRDSTKLYNCENVASDYQSICSASLNKNSQDMAFNQQAYATAGQRSSQIQSLMAQINSTSDQKSIDELSARINAEGVAVANESNRLQLAAQMQQNADKAIAQQDREWYLSAVQRPGALNGYVYTP